MAGDAITEPFPISKVADNYLLFDVDVVSHVRRNYNICGTLIGSLPQVPQQSVFLGLPVQLMPEEARILVEDGHAYIVDDADAHRAAFLDGALSTEEGAAYARAIESQGREAALAVARQAEEKKEKALRKVSKEQRRKRQTSEETSVSSATLLSEEVDASLFAAGAPTDDAASAASTRPMTPQVTPFGVTPTTSYPSIRTVQTEHVSSMSPAPSSYPLFAYLHRKGYFMMPGLRFGCQYNVYPGDPLRFHSHFLAVGRQWDDEFKMMEIVGGGRLGTGVKKGFMLGGEVEDEDSQSYGETRTFCFEWAGM